MKRINYGRVLVGGILAGVLLFLADGFIHEKLLKDHWMAAMTGGRSQRGGRAARRRHALLRGLRAAARPGHGLGVLRLPHALRPGSGHRGLRRARDVGDHVPDLLPPGDPARLLRHHAPGAVVALRAGPSVVAGLVAGALYKDPPAGA